MIYNLQPSLLYLITVSLLFMMSEEIWGKEIHLFATFILIMHILRLIMGWNNHNMSKKQGWLSTWLRLWENSIHMMPIFIFIFFTFVNIWQYLNTYSSSLYLNTYTLQKLFIFVFKGVLGYTIRLCFFSGEEFFFGTLDNFIF